MANDVTRSSGNLPTGGIKYYTLDDDGKTPVPCPDMFTWARWFETADRTMFSTETANLWISTVFLGLDHGFMSNVPILFETMVFPKEGAAGIHFGEIAGARYATWEDAKVGHDMAVTECIKVEQEAARLSMGLPEIAPTRRLPAPE